MHFDEFWDCKSKPINKAVIDIVVFIICMEGEPVRDLTILELFSGERFDIDLCLIEYIRDLPEEAELVMEDALHFKRDTTRIHIAPVGRHTSIELDLLDILTVEFVYCDDPDADISDNFIGWRWIATEGELVGNIALLPDHDGHFFCITSRFESFFFEFMISLFDFFLRSEEIKDDVIMNRLDHTSRLA